MEVIKWILMIAGGMLIALIVAIFIIVMYVKWKFRKLMSTLNEGLAGLAGAATSLPGFRVELTPADPFEWHHADKGEAAVEALKARGFVEAGRYTIDETPDIRIVGLVNEAQSLAAVVYDQSTAGVRIDVVFDETNGRQWNITDLPDNGMDHRESDIKVRHPGAEVGVLVDVAMEHRTKVEARPIKISGFKAMFENAYAEEMNWRANRGGYSLDEVRRVMQASGQTEGETDENTVRTIQVMFNSRIREGLDEVLREKLLDTSMMTAGEWQKVSDRIAFVHDMLAPTEMADLLAPVAFEESEMDDDADDAEAEDGDVALSEAEKWRERVEADVAATSPRRAFAKALAEVPRRDEVRKIATLTDPVGADVYVMPVVVEDEE